MSKKNVYIQVHDGSRYFIDTLDTAIESLKAMAISAQENGDHSELTLSTVKMTQEEFDNLEEFQGF